MIAYCKNAGLSEPGFEQRGGQFVVTIWRDWLTDTILTEFGLNERQKMIIVFIKSNTRISNAECQNITGATRKTVSRDLDLLVTAGLLIRVGERRGTYYVLSRIKHKGATRYFPRILTKRPENIFETFMRHMRHAIIL
jgi:predicted HTH transcriptional regulator